MNAKWLIVLIVDSIVENLHLIQASGFNPEDSRRMSRASIMITPDKPMRFSTFRPSMLSAKPESSESWDVLESVQQKEAEAVTEALKLMSHKEAVRKQMPESAAKRKTEAAIEGNVRAALKKHQVAEAEVQAKAKKLVKKNRNTTN
jgi:hypothetical protein